MKICTCRIRSPSLMRPSLAAMLFGSTCTREPRNQCRQPVIVLPCVLQKTQVMWHALTTALSCLPLGEKTLISSLTTSHFLYRTHFRWGDFGSWLTLSDVTLTEHVLKKKTTFKLLHVYGSDVFLLQLDESTTHIFHTASHWICIWATGKHEALDNHVLNFVVLAQKIKRDGDTWKTTEPRRNRFLKSHQYCSYVHFNEEY